MLLPEMGFKRENFRATVFLGGVLIILARWFPTTPPNKLLNNCMDSKDKDDIRKLLTAIEQMTRQADAQAKMEVLQMLGMTSQSVIAMVKKLAEPKVKTRTVTKYIEKPAKKKPKQAAKTTKPPTATTDKPAVSASPVKPVPPVAPLSNQRHNQTES